MRYERRKQKRELYRALGQPHPEAPAPCPGKRRRANSRLYARALYEYTTTIASPLAPQASASRTRELGATMVARNDLVIRHCGKKRKVNDLADHNQFPMRLFGNNVDAKRGSWALLKSQPKPTLAAQQPAQSSKRKAAR